MYMQYKQVYTWLYKDNACRCTLGYIKTIHVGVHADIQIIHVCVHVEIQTTCGYVDSTDMTCTCGQRDIQTKHVHVCMLTIYTCICAGGQTLNVCVHLEVQTIHVCVHVDIKTVHMSTCGYIYIHVDIIDNVYTFVYM